MSVMSNQIFSMNGVKEAGTSSDKGLCPSRCPTEQQGGPGCHCTTAKGVRKRKWFQEVTRIVMEIKELIRVRKSQWM